MKLSREDFDRMRADYSLLVNFCISNPIISALLNNFEDSESLDSYVGLVIYKTPEYFIPQIIVALLESELVFVSQNADPSAFLRNRARVSSRIIGGMCQKAAGAIIAKQLHDIVMQMYHVKIRDVQSPKKMADAFMRCVDAVLDIYLPEVVSFAICEVFSLAKAYGMTYYRYELCGNLFFLRLICPALIGPEFYGVADYLAGAPSYPARKALALLARLFCEATTCIGSDRAASEENDLYKEVICSTRQRFQYFVDKICAVIYFGVRHFSNTYPNTTFITIERNDGISGIQQLRYSFIPELEANSVVFGLSALARLHYCLKHYYTEITDVCAAISYKNAPVTTIFERYIDHERFYRLLSRYVEFWHCENNDLGWQLNTLLEHITAPPLVFNRVVSYNPSEEMVPTFYRVIKENSAGKRQSRVVRFTVDSLLNVDHNDTPQHYKRGPFFKYLCPVIKNEMTGGDIQLVCTTDRSIRIEFSERKEAATLGKQQKRLPRVYYFEDDTMRDRMLLELVEMCFIAVHEPYLFVAIWMQGDKYQKIQIKLGKDCIMLIDGDRIVYDAHFSKIQSVEEHGETVSLRIKGVSEFLIFRLAQRRTLAMLLLTARDYYIGVQKPDLETIET